MYANRNALMKLSGVVLVWWAVLLMTTLAEAQVAPPPNLPLEREDTEAAEWPYFFPVLGKAAVAEGYNLPRPLGLNLNFFIASQEVKISELQVGFNDGRKYNLDFIEFDEIKAETTTGNVRLDLWIFPFLNIYGIIVGGDAATSVKISAPFSLSTVADFTGIGYGGGLTGAYGFENFWVSLDTNWISMDLDKLQDNVMTNVLSLRAGKNLVFKNGMELAFWAGAMRIKLDSETKGSIELNDLFPGANLVAPIDWLISQGQLTTGQLQDLQALRGQIAGLSPNDVTIDYRLKKEPEDPWNVILGAQFMLSESWFLRAEVGFFRRVSVLASLQYRFGITAF